MKVGSMLTLVRMAFHPHTEKSGPRYLVSKIITV